MAAGFSGTWKDNHSAAAAELSMWAASDELPKQGLRPILGEPYRQILGQAT